MRDTHLGNEPDETIAGAVGMTGEQVTEMYRLLAIAKYEDRYVIPTTHPELEREFDEVGCSLDGVGGPGMQASVGAFHGVPDSPSPNRPSTSGRINLLNWDARAPTAGLFPPKGD